MIDEIENLMEKYWKWLRDKTALRQVGDVVEITTPYLDRHNDYLQIYVKREGDELLITDDGYTIADLEMSGCAMNGAKRQSLLRTTLAGFGVQCGNNNALQTRATPKNFAMCKHNLMQAMLAVNDLFYTARAKNANLFNEDVKQWLDLSDIRHIARTKLGGKSGFDHFFDFVVPSSKSAPERLLRAINRPGRESVQAAVFSWNDTKKVRSDFDSQMYVFLNDLEDSERTDKPSKSAVSPNVVSALKNDGIHPVPWSNRDSVRTQLAA